MTYRIAQVDRRTLLRLLGSSAAVGLAVRFDEAPASAASANPPMYGAEAMPHGIVNNPHVFIALAASGEITLVCHRAEMGQGVRTGLPMIIADELEADWARVKVVQAPGDEARYGNQDTDGSRSVRHFYHPLRECGAAARMMLEQAAAERWGVPVDEVKAELHEIVHRSTARRIGYGDLAEALSSMAVPQRQDLRLKDPKDFRYIGRGLPIVDIFAITTGAPLYSVDVRQPGMLYAVVARPPVYGGKLVSYEAGTTEKLRDVVKVIEIAGPKALPSKFQPLGGVAVVARNSWAALEGRNALEITWDPGPNGGYESTAFRAYLEATAKRPGKVVRSRGNDASASPGRRIIADYYIPHLAQAPMEPMSATARVSDGKCEIWTGVQAPQVARTEVAARLGLDPANVTVNTTLLGGGFGRKSKPDYIVEAAVIAQEFSGTPVKLFWSREDDIQHGYYHTVSVEHLEGTLDERGHVTSWLHRSVAPSIGSIFQPDVNYEAPFELGMGFIDVPFEIANIRCENGEAPAQTRIGWYRSVSNIPHAFAMHSFVHELAVAAGREPEDLLLELIGPPRAVDVKTVEGFWNYGESLDRYPIDTGRLRAIAEAVLEKSDWAKRINAGAALGIAVHRSFVSYIATVVEVAVTDGRISVPRVDVAVDCGCYINPDRVIAQIEGACVMGLSNALASEITFEKGAVTQSNFTDYEVARMDAAPRDIRVHLSEQNFNQLPGGIGEPGVPPFAPALANAIFVATGRRIRALPARDQLKGPQRASR